MFAVLDGEPAGFVEVEDIACAERFLGAGDFARKSDLRRATENSFGGLLATFHGTVKQAEAVEALEARAEGFGVGNALRRKLGEVRLSLIRDGETGGVSQNNSGGKAGRERA